VDPVAAVAKETHLQQLPHKEMMAPQVKVAAVEQRQPEVAFQALEAQEPQMTILQVAAQQLMLAVEDLVVTSETPVAALHPAAVVLAETDPAAQETQVKLTPVAVAALAAQMAAAQEELVDLEN
jgi:hypothetical protein